MVSAVSPAPTFGRFQAVALLQPPWPNPALKRDAPPAMQAPRPLALR
jgi:hypothetical protein